MQQEPIVWQYRDNDFVEVKPGMRRKVFNGDNLSLCLWRINESVPPTPYDSHPDNEQFGLIVKGTLDFRLGSDERVELGPGSVYYAPRGCDHGDSVFIGGEDGEVWILDIFSPIREEYRNG